MLMKIIKTLTRASRTQRWLLALALLVLAAGAILYIVKSKDHYDPGKYDVAISNGLQPGSKIEMTLPDQFDVSHTLSTELRTLILAFQKKSGSVVRGFLDTQDAHYLSQRNAAFVVDISPFPVVLRNTMALPLLRKSRYPVLLIYEEAMAEALKDEEHADEIAIATLAQGVVVAVRYVTSEEQLKAALEGQGE